MKRRSKSFFFWRKAFQCRSIRLQGARCLYALHRGFCLVGLLFLNLLISQSVVSAAPVSVHTSFAASLSTSPSLMVLQDDASQKKEAAEQLSKALDYFASQKYHECLMILQELDKYYRLNPRYKAYLGVCYYYLWDYKPAIQYLSEAIPQLGNFAPHERSFYHWANAESHFNLQQYAEAIPFYQAMLPLCHDNEKPDVHYRLGFCYLFAEQWNEAWNELLKAQEGYLKLRNTPDMQARIAQVSHMLDGLKPKVVSLVLDKMLKK